MKKGDIAYWDVYNDYFGDSIPHNDFTYVDNGIPNRKFGKIVKVSGPWARIQRDDDKSFITKHEDNIVVTS